MTREWYIGLVGGLSFGIIVSAWATRFGYGPNDLAVAAVSVATIGLVGCLVHSWESRQ